MIKSPTLAIVLTVIPITDILGANWFYLGWTKVGIAKVALFLLYLIFGVVMFDLGLLFLFILVIWWIVDIPLIASGRIKPKLD